MMITPVKGSDYFANLCNVGYAHGHARSNDVEAFKDALANVYAEHSDKGLFCVTNSIQVKERQYLTEIGFSETVSGTLYVHTCSRTQLNKVLDTRLEKTRALWAEWNAKNEAEGRAPGELRPGDFVWCQRSKYTICKVKDDQVWYIGGWVEDYKKYLSSDWSTVATTFHRRPEFLEN